MVTPPPVAVADAELALAAAGSAFAVDVASAVVVALLTGRAIATVGTAKLMAVIAPLWSHSLNADAEPDGGSLLLCSELLFSSVAMLRFAVLDRN